MANLFSISKLKQKLSLILNSNQTNNLKTFIFKSIAGTFGMKVANAVLSYGIVLLLANFLGAKGYGAYAYALTLVGILQIPALLGLRALLTRELAVYQTQGSWELASGLVNWSNRVTFISSIALSLLAVYFTWQFKTILPDNSIEVIWIALLTLPLVVLINIKQAAMQG